MAGDEPEPVHQALAAALDSALDRIAEIQRRARDDGETARACVADAVLRTPKGWTGPREVDGQQVEDTWRSHQVPMTEARENTGHRQLLEEWMRSYRPEELFDETGRLVPELAALAPEGERRMGANPHANGGLLLRDLSLPDFRDYAVDVSCAGHDDQRGDAGARRLAPRRHGPQRRDLPPLRPRRDGVEPARRGVRGDRQDLGGRDGSPSTRACRPTAA